MGIMEKVVSVLGFVEREEEDVEEVVEEKASTQKPAPMAVRQEGRPAPRLNNVVAFNGGKESANREDNTNARVVLVEPIRFEESQGIADNLLEQRAVVINIESCDTEVAAKIIDFVGGVVYAIDGTIQKVSHGIILAAPNNIDIASELKNNDLATTDEEIFAWISQYNHRGDF